MIDQPSPKSIEDLVTYIEERIAGIDNAVERAKAESNPDAKMFADDHYLKHPVMENAYNDTANAVRDVTVAAFNLMANQLGITGFQGSWAALNAYAVIMNIDSPFSVYRLEDALYPQYDLPKRLREWLLSDENVKWLGDQAEEKLAEYREESQFVSPRVIEHWKMLVRRRDLIADAAQADIPE